METKLDQLIDELQRGRKAGSVISAQTLSSISSDDKVTWRSIRKEMEDIGITVAAFYQNREFIFQWFINAIKDGAFEEKLQDSDRDSELNRVEDNLEFGFSWTDGIRSNDSNATEFHEHERPNPRQQPNNYQSQTDDLRTLPRGSKSPPNRVAEPAITMQTFVDAMKISNFEEALKILNDTKRSHLFDEGVLKKALMDVCNAHRYRNAINRGNEESLVLSLWTKLPQVQCLKETYVRLYPNATLVTLKDSLISEAIRRDWPKVLEILDPETDTIFANGHFGHASVLQMAVEEGNLNCVRFLMRKGADVGYGPPSNATALAWAISLGHNNVARELIDNGASCSLRTHIKVAIDRQNINGVKLMIEKSADRPLLWELRHALNAVKNDNHWSQGDSERLLKMLAETDPRHIGYFQADGESIISKVERMLDDLD